MANHATIKEHLSFCYGGLNTVFSEKENQVKEQFL